MKNRELNLIKVLLLALGLLIPVSLSAQETDEKLVGAEQILDPDKPVALSVEALKKKVIELNRDLFILEEDLLFPANTQFVVYVSLDTGKFLQLDSIKLTIDEEVVAAHLYTESQTKALHNGGMQRLHIGNLKSGEHQMVVVLNGVGPNNKELRLASDLNFEKGSDIKSLEIRIKDESSNYQPSISIAEWN